ncbi:MAG: DUF3576 domain-containing protein [Alphaproteobacteria bacterium]|nr:DUF3576 domain-containing protein [Alphaproteobacteria bacterium]
MKFTYFTFFIFALMAGCSLPQSSKKPTIDSPGSIITGSAEQGLSLRGAMSKKQSGAGLPINALLWRSSIDIASSLPMEDVDAISGTIITDWYKLNENSDERIKIAIFVLDRELRSDGIRVVVYVQKRDGSEWSDEGTDSEMSSRLEELILTRAREIRAETVRETN